MAKSSKLPPQSSPTDKNEQWKEAFPQYDWGENEDKTSLHPLSTKQESSATTTTTIPTTPTTTAPSSKSSSSSLLEKEKTSYQASHEPFHRKSAMAPTSDMAQTGQEISLVNIPTRTIGCYTLMRNPLLGISLVGMFGSYGALFHSIIARAPAKNTFYWGNLCVAWKLAIIAVICTRGVWSHGKPGGTLYREYVQVRDV